MSRTEPRIIRAVWELQQWSERMRCAGKRIALVPTMGSLHLGHLSLLRMAQHHADRTIVSIFVNPTQFGPNEDFDSYPRDLEADLEQVRKVGADVAFPPAPDRRCPAGAATWVTGDPLTQGLCGRSRPGHFRGVATVVARLFQAARPHVAIFGEKDYQQLAVIRRMARDLLFDTEIVGAPTVREPDGLAMSSRNRYLSDDARLQARALNIALHEARQHVRAGERDVRFIAEATRRRIAKEPLAELDYVEICDPETLAPLDRIGRRAILAVAASFEGARLIDNTLLEADG